jgi:DNA-binding MurR/RpiR family transcriptional regulator
MLALGPNALVLSAAALARRFGTSDATIVRTAKALGYPSLAALRSDLAESATNPSPDERLRRTLTSTSPDHLLEQFVTDQVRALETLIRNVDVREFDLAAETLAAAETVVWRGVGPSAELARYGELLTVRIGKPSSSFVKEGTSFADELLTLTYHSAVVLLAYGRVQSHVTALLDRASELALPVVLVTDTLGPTLSDQVTATLRSGRGTPGEFASHTATLTLIEALTLAIAARTRATTDAALTKLNDLRASIAGRRLDVDTP